MGEISVIIVSWNGLRYLRDCLASLRHTGGSSIREILVIDNASTDGSIEMVEQEFPEVKLIKSPRNLGFAGANNLGIRNASGPLLAFINSDVTVHTGCLQQLAAVLQADPRVGLVGPKVCGADGRLQRTCRRLPTVWNLLGRVLPLDEILPAWPVFSPFRMWYPSLNRCAPVEVLSGCFWLARRQAVDEVGCLDERFFFYAEDVDWSKRFGNAGWKLMFVPEATVTHFGGGSTSNAPLRFSIEILRSNLLYWKIHHGRIGLAAFYLIAVGQHTLRLLARGLMSLTGFAGKECKHKLKEHFVCVRWLLTGKSAC